jgi:hypothetical protein
MAAIKRALRHKGAPARQGPLEPQFRARRLS